MPDRKRKRAHSYEVLDLIPPVIEHHPDLAEITLNKGALEALFLHIFAPTSTIQEVVYKKWLKSISVTDEPTQGLDMTRILHKLTVCKGELQFGPRYVQFFSERNGMACPEDQELHLPGEFLCVKEFMVIFSVLKRFCQGEKVEKITGYVLKNRYKYDLILTQIIDRARVHMICSFIKFFIEYYDGIRFYGPGLATRRFKNICSVHLILDMMTRDMSRPLHKSLLIAAGHFRHSSTYANPYFFSTTHLKLDSAVVRILERRQRKKKTRSPSLVPTTISPSSRLSIL
jgi:hypothetical protein